MAKIPLIGGGEAIIDDCDEHWISRFKWKRMQPERAYSPYAATLIGNNVIYMHRLVVGECGKGMVADHIDHDGLNNRRSNLRICHYTQNAAHSRKVRESASPFKGVRRSENGRWRAEVTRLGKRAYLGGYETEEEAARAYDRKVVELDGPFAVTNESLGLFSR